MGFSFLSTLVFIFFCFSGRLFAAAPPMAYVTPSAPVISSSVAVVPSPAIVLSTAEWRAVSNMAFQAGEQCDYVVKWGIITAGHSLLSIPSVDTIQDRPAYHLVSEARSSGIVDLLYSTRDRNDAWLDTQSLTTLRYEKHIR
jgi:hypothetical protein